MRIAHVTATFPPYYGGTGNVCYHNARVLAARGHDIHVFTADWPGAIDDPPGVTVHRLKPLARIGNAPVLPQLRRLANFDLVHLHLPFYFGGEFTYLSGCRYVVTYHQDVMIDGLLGYGTRLFDRSIGKFVLQHAERVCPTSIDYLQHSAIASLWHQHPERVVEMPNGVDTEHFQPGPLDASIRRQLGLPLGATTVLFVGAMDQAHYFKGVPILLHALTGLPDVVAILAGDGERRNGYMRLASKLGIADRVRFTGRVSDDELPDYYRAADVLVLPSVTRGEAFGLVLLEAMASGRPVIASNLPGVRTVVSPDQDGMLVSPNSPTALAEAIQRIAALPPQQREAMGKKARANVERCFSWEAIGDQLERLYEDVIQPSGSHVAQPSQAFDETTMPFEIRAALELIVERCSTRPGLIAATAVGDDFLIERLAAYGTINGDGDTLVALNASQAEIQQAIEHQQPGRVLSLLPGVLDRPLRKLRTTHLSLTPDPPVTIWQRAGYRRVADTGIQGLGALAFAGASRLAQRLGRPDLTDQLRFTMIESFPIARFASRCSALTVREYRRVA